jgi:uncharacterized protein (DUF488 family)
MTTLSEASRPRVFSIGHSTHELAEFVRLLRDHEVEQVVDVRAHPGSRRLPWFGREALAQELIRSGLSYVHLPELGGRRRPLPDSPNSGWEVAAFRAYADHMASAEFATGLETLQGLAGRRATAMMCAEGLWWRCHRRLISDALTVAGWDVLHIAPDGATSLHELTQFAVLEGDRLTYPSAQTSL